MRVLFVSNLFPSVDEPLRGWDNLLVLQALRRNFDTEFRVVSPRPSRPWQTAEIRPRSEDRWCNPAFPRVAYIPKVGGVFNSALMAFSLRVELERLFDEWNPDCVLSSWLFPDGCAVERLLRRHGKGIPLVQITQGTDTHAYLTSSLRRRQIVASLNSKVTRKVICRSGDLAGRLAGVGVDAEKLTTIYNGVDDSLFYPGRGVADGPRSIVFVGNMLAVKNLRFLLRVHRELNARLRHANREAVVLKLIGDGPLRSSLEAEVASSPETGHVEFLGRLTPSEVGKYMRQASALCLTSHNEGFPNVILEALATKLPVVSTNVGGIHELIDRPARGRLVEPGDLEGFVTRLEETLDKSGELEEDTGDRDLDLSWSRAAHQYHEILEAVVSVK